MSLGVGYLRALGFTYGQFHHDVWENLVKRTGWADLSLVPKYKLWMGCVLQVFEKKMSWQKNGHCFAVSAQVACTRCNWTRSAAGGVNPLETLRQRPSDTRREKKTWRTSRILDLIYSLIFSLNLSTFSIGAALTSDKAQLIWGICTPGVPASPHPGGRAQRAISPLCKHCLFV